MSDVSDKNDVSDEGDVIEKSDEEWRRALTPAQYEVLRRKGTEPPFSGDYVYNKTDGTYRCGACGAELFTSRAKFDSGTGWPSFTEPAVAANVTTVDDTSHGMRRTEALCARCGGHLGHVFPDGPGENGMRYCINSLALAFDEGPAPAPPDPGGPARKPSYPNVRGATPR